jgi:hypothetical protein
MRNPILQIPLIPIHHPRVHRPRVVASLPMLVFLLLCLPVGAHAQQVDTQTHTPPVVPGIGPDNNSNGGDPSLRRMTEQMAMRRNTERQQQIVSDSAHLLDLAQKLNDEVTKSTKDELSVSVVKKADEIEKLAKSIKEKMRDGS